MQPAISVLQRRLPAGPGCRLSLDPKYPVCISCLLGTFTHPAASPGNQQQRLWSIVLRVSFLILTVIGHTMNSLKLKSVRYVVSMNFFEIVLVRLTESGYCGKISLHLCHIKVKIILYKRMLRVPGGKIYD